LFVEREHSQFVPSFRTDPDGGKANVVIRLGFWFFGNGFVFFVAELNNRLRVSA
jgi:hypothetical protein